MALALAVLDTKTRFCTMGYHSLGSQQPPYEAEHRLSAFDPNIDLSVIACGGTLKEIDLPARIGKNRDESVAKSETVLHGSEAMVILYLSPAEKQRISDREKREDYQAEVFDKPSDVRPTGRKPKGRPAKKANLDRDPRDRRGAIVPEYKATDGIWGVNSNAPRTCRFDTTEEWLLHNIRLRTDNGESSRLQKGRSGVKFLRDHYAGEPADFLPEDYARMERTSAKRVCAVWESNEEMVEVGSYTLKRRDSNVNLVERETLTKLSGDNIPVMHGIATDRRQYLVPGQRSTVKREWIVQIAEAENSHIKWSAGMSCRAAIGAQSGLATTSETKAAAKIQ
ncbi:hypothetical protein BKA93DRAFT_880316 [Sparassis latifolia]